MWLGGRGGHKLSEGGVIRNEAQVKKKSFKCRGEVRTVDLTFNIGSNSHFSEVLSSEK